MTVACTGAGGTASAEVQLTVPMPVYATSYENRHLPVIDTPTTPFIVLIPGITKEPGEQEVNSRSIAFADFSQNGSYDTALVTTTIHKGYDDGAGNPGGFSDSPSKLYFLRKSSTGVWSDVTRELLADVNNRYTCISSGFMLVADFNNDKKPDVYVTCAGKDYQPTVYRESDLGGLSYQYVILSRPDGKYDVKRVDNRPLYGHSAVAVDVDQDGHVDVLTVDPSCGGALPKNLYSCKPVALLGRGDGTFIEDATMFPEDSYGKPIFNISSFMVDGKFYVVLAGMEAGSQPDFPFGSPNAYGTKVMAYVNGKLQYVDITMAPPTVARTGLPYGMLFDTVYRDGNIYSLRLDGNYEGEGYIKTNLATGESVVLLSRRTGGDFGSGNPGMLKITSSNQLVGMMSGCNVDIPDDGKQACRISINLN